jgi:hypothetical protein
VIGESMPTCPTKPFDVVNALPIGWRSRKPSLKCRAVGNGWRSRKAQKNSAQKPVGFTAKRFNDSARGFNPGNASNQAGRPERAKG